MAMVASASATTYRWTWNSLGSTNGAQPGGGELFYNPAGGQIKNIDAQFNQSNANLKYEVNFKDRQTDGLWLVLSPGENPKGHAGQLSIFFLDASGSQPTLLAYSYNGVNGHQSWKDGSPAAGTQAPDLILSSLKTTDWINSLSVVNVAGGGQKFSFDINAAAIQNHTPKYPGPQGQSEWTGSAFGNKFGIWMHTVNGLETSYQNGALKSWTYCEEGWVDGGNLQTVPEPGSMTALGLGIAAMLRRMRNNKK